MDTNTDLYYQLQRGPVFLLLGQNYLRLETGNDPLLTAVIQKFNLSLADDPTYSLLFQSSQIKENTETSLAWIQETCSRLSRPAWLDTVVHFPWSGIYTSAIDTIVWNTFATEGRQVTPLFEAKYWPQTARSRTNLNCTYLFGCVDRQDEAERPPISLRELRSRVQKAIGMIRRLPELVTPMGTLIIEGYALGNDWLHAEDHLLPIIDEFNPGQVHLFNSPEDALSNDFVEQLYLDGKITLHQESLAMFLHRGQATGKLKTKEALLTDIERHQIFLKHDDRVDIVPIPVSLWNSVSRSAIILDDRVMMPPGPISKQVAYQEFRSFLADSGNRPIWSGYARKFAFRRVFQKELLNSVQNLLSMHEFRDKPIILHGQSGTGKTVALGAIAYHIRSEGRFPVLFIERRSQYPSFEEIENFCLHTEKYGALSNLIIWDGMFKDSDPYHEMLRFLRSKGRNVVLVGSCYALGKKNTLLKKNQTLRIIPVEAPIEISLEEESDLKEFLREVDVDPYFIVNLDKKDRNFLVALYRTLPESRSPLRQAVVREINHFEQEFRRRADEGDIIPEFNNALGYALYKAGKITDKDIFSNETYVIDTDEITELQELIGLVMVPGRFGLYIPIELLLHTLSKNHIANFVDYLRGDIFHWFEDARTGNIFIGPRHQLEARLFTQARLGLARTEMEYIKKLLLGINRSEWSDDDIQIQFAVDLVRSIGPNGEEPKYFEDFYPEISEILQTLRLDKGVVNPRLMLQEANLLREWVKERNTYRDREMFEQSEKFLDRAEQILRYALEMIGSETIKTRKLRSVILVELASTIGARIQKSLPGRVYEPYEIKNLFQLAREAVFDSIAIDTVNYYPVDVLCWVTMDILDGKVFTEEERFDAIADVVHLLNSFEPDDLSDIQQELFLTKGQEFYRCIGREDLSERAFQELKNRGSSAGYYVRAISHLPSKSVIQSMDDRGDYESYESAVQYLESNWEFIKNDRRCLILLFRLWWFMQTREPLLSRERQCVGLSKEGWQRCIAIIKQMREVKNPSFVLPLKYKYFYGLAAFHIGDFHLSFTAFQELRHESKALTGGIRRILRSHLASTPEGHPRVFTGSVESNPRDGRAGQVFVPEIRQHILFFPQEFNQPEIRKGQSLGQFHIAFNFLSPVAEPISYLKRYKE